MTNTPGAGELIERLSFEPLPMEQFDGLSQRERNLQHIGDVIGYWLKWVTGEREAEGLSTGPDTHIMLPNPNAPPHWPTVAQLTKWLEVIRTYEAAALSRPALAGEASVESIAARLIDQSDEPWPSGTEGDRLHYWRDKAINAAKALRSLAEPSGGVGEGAGL
jgi:hypothetical protein